MKSCSALGLCLVLVACAPSDMADKVGRRAADTVVRPVVSDYMAGAQADIVTRCIVENGSADEIKQLSRDVAVEAGPATVDLVFKMARNPAAMDCMQAAGLPPLEQVAL